MSTRIDRPAALIALIGFEAAAVTLLHALGVHSWMRVDWGNLGGWLESATVEGLAAAVLRSTALAIAYWLAASTTMYLIARLLRFPRLIRAAARTTLPAIRRTINRTVAVTVTSATLVSPLGPGLVDERLDSQRDPVVSESAEGVPTPVFISDSDPTVIVPPRVGSVGYTPKSSGVDIVRESTPHTTRESTPHTTRESTPHTTRESTPHTTRESTPQQTYEVAPGDNMWTISERHLATIFGNRQVSADEVSAYWRSVVETNTPRIKSGNPNLVHPGEVLILPSVDTEETP